MKTFIFILLSMLTTYSDGTFHTECSNIANASFIDCSNVLDTLISQLQTNPEKLSKWAFAGTGEQTDKKKDVLFLVWKTAEYDSFKNYSRLTMDILVNGRVMCRDVIIESFVDDSLWNDNRKIRVDISYSGSVLKSAYGHFHLSAMNSTTTKMSMDVHVQFGWFFRIFISKKIYSDTIDWRIERFVRNLCLTSEGIIPSDDYWEE